jgi:hypothetical protein
VPLNVDSEALVERAAGNSRLAHVVGMLAFIVGVAILVFVFFLAHHLFSSPYPGIGHPAGSAGPTAMNLSDAALALVAQIGRLFIMTIVGSLIAGLGVRLYLGCPNYPGKS